MDNFEIYDNVFQTLSLMVMRDHPKICVNLRCGVE